MSKVNLRHALMAIAAVAAFAVAPLLAAGTAQAATTSANHHPLFHNVSVLPTNTTPANITPDTVPVRCNDGTRIRTSPPSGTIIGLCYHTQHVYAICYRLVSGWYHAWHKIHDSSTNKTGWSYGGDLTVTGPGSEYAC